MKANSLLALLLLVTPLAAQSSKAPAGAAEVAPKPELLPNQLAFTNLPEASRKDWIKHVTDATRFFQDKRIFECMEALDKAERIFSDSPEIYNLRGSCFVELRAFDKALTAFEKSKTFAKNNPSVEFNIAEVYFVTKEWKKALTQLEGILKILPAKSEALGRLVEFKILLCKNKLGQADEVTILAAKYTDEDDSPYYYYAQAALAYEKNDLAEAEEWIARAGRIFRDPNMLAPWQDTMVEYGYVKSFYGEDLAAPDAVAPVPK